MAKKRFWVEPSRTLEHDGVRVEGGQPIQLDEDVAKLLLEAGILLSDAPGEGVNASLEETDRTLEKAARRQPRR